MKKVNFYGVECNVQFNEYENGRTAILLMEGGTRYAVATVNDPDVPLESNQVLIKDYSENSGILDALVSAEIVTRTEDYVLMGPYGAKAWICNLN
jgi:hypothetical protein